MALADDLRRVVDLADELRRDVVLADDLGRVVDLAVELRRDVVLADDLKEGLIPDGQR